MIPLLAILLPGIAGLAAWFWASRRWGPTRAATYAAAAAALTLVLVLSGALWWRGRQLRAAREDARTQALAIDSLEATADTLRVHVLSADSSRQVAERRAVQANLERDSIDELLGTERRARVSLEARVDSLRITSESLVAIDSLRPEVRLVDATVREAPYTVHIAGEVGPDTARLRVAVDLDPVSLTVGVHCGPANATGIRPARVSIETPDWLTVGTLEPQLDPTTCNPPPPPPPTLWQRVKIGGTWALGGIVVGGLAAIIFVP